MWQLRTFSEDGQPLQTQNIQGYELDMNETDINASLVPVFVPDAFRSAAVIPHSADALMQTAVCTAFSLPTGACSSPHWCELLLHTPVGFIPEDEFCGSTFQRGQVIQNRLSGFQLFMTLSIIEPWWSEWLRSRLVGFTRSRGSKVGRCQSFPLPDWHWTRTASADFMQLASRLKLRTFPICLRWSQNPILPGQRWVSPMILWYVDISRKPAARLGEVIFANKVS